MRFAYGIRVSKTGSDVINANVTISDRKTFYTKYGNLFSILNLFTLILIGLFTAFKKITK